MPADRGRRVAAVLAADSHRTAAWGITTSNRLLTPLEEGDLRNVPNLTGVLVLVELQVLKVILK